ncbi:MAG TPA: HepT-like ribonuclease domain-containing protein [Polyangiales bacterium]
MTVRPEVVRERLAHLALVLTQLERLRSMPSEQRSADVLYQLAAERALQVAAEVLFDIGHHVLAGRGARVPSS